MSSQSAQDPATSGPPAIGPTVPMATSGFQARGSFLLKLACSGLQASGTGMTASTFGTTATGERKLASMAESTTDSATPVPASSAVTGRDKPTTTTAQ